MEIRHPESETRFSPQKTQNCASVIELKIATLGGSGNRLKALREGKRTFDIIAAWMPPGEVPPPRMTLVSLG